MYDSEIKKILDYWYSGDINNLYKNRWFVGKEKRSKVDEFIKDNFYELLVAAENGHLESWKDKASSLLALITLFDQFSRHIYRNENEESHQNKTIKANTAKALELSQLFISKGWDKFLRDREFVFLMMPFRHSRTAENIKYVIEKTKNRTEANSEETKLLNKFQSVSIKCLEHMNKDSNKKESEFTDEDILEHLPFKTDESDIPKSKVYQSIEQFLKRNFKIPYPTQVVSLSGGVDSMVIMKVLTVLGSKYRFKTVAIHIDYGNRKESGTEAEYVEKYSDYLGVIFEKIVITSIKRGVTKRDEYEKKTREIRFNAYTDILNRHGAKGIYQGHHKGDIQENVISNVMKGNTVLNLAGMKKISNISGVNIYRPLLEDPKKLIFQFAHRFGIPYFKNTTPEWSNRGKIRNKLIPLLTEIYGEGFLNNVTSIAQESHDVSSVMESIIQSKIEQIVETKLAFSINLIVIENNELYLWKRIISYMFQRAGLNHSPNIKSLRNLIKTLKKGEDIKSHWFPFSKESFALINNRRLLTFKKNILNLNFTKYIGITEGKFDCGRWIIIIKKTDTIKNRILNISEFTLLSGNFSFQIKSSCAFNIESDKNVKMIGEDVSAKGFPMVIPNKKITLESCDIYDISYAISDS